MVARAFGVLVLLTGFAVTGAAAYLTAHHERTESETVSAHRAEQIASVIESRFALYTALVRGGEALFAGSEQVTRADWRVFARTLGVPDAYPGAASLLFIRRLPAATLARDLAAIRADASSTARSSTTSRSSSRRSATTHACARSPPRRCARPRNGAHSRFPGRST